jgi:hypothetical protein
VTLARRLLAGSLIVVTALVAAIVLIAGGRLRNRLVEEKRDELARVGRVVALQWQPGTDAQALAQRAGGALGYRVTLIDSTGVVVGDAEFGPEARRRLENHFDRPEVVEARERGVGASRRHSASAGDDELYVAQLHHRLRHAAREQRRQRERTEQGEQSADQHVALGAAHDLVESARRDRHAHVAERMPLRDVQLVVTRRRAVPA